MRGSLALASLLLSESFCKGAGSGIEKAVRLQPLPVQVGETFEGEFQLGSAGPVSIAFRFADGTVRELKGELKPDSWVRQIEKDGKKVSETALMPDAAIEFQSAGLRFPLHVRPRLVRYTEAQRADLALKWETLPAASQHWTHLRTKPASNGVELWLDGRYCGLLGSDKPLIEVAFKNSSADVGVRGTRTFTPSVDGLYLPLDVAHIARPGSMEHARVSLPHGLQSLRGVPIQVAAASANADVGFAREMQGSRALETDENTSRTSLDGMPESLHFSVPQAFYRRAWVLCAAEKDPSKSPVLTTRLTRFAVSGRGEAMADTSIVIPRELGNPGLEGAEEVGIVEYAAPDGSLIKVPLCLVPIELQAGSILDLLSDQSDPNAAMKIGPYLDFEFLGKCGGLQVQRDLRRKPVASSRSAVHVFGVTLEKAPVEVRLKQFQPGNIFHNDEQPETALLLTAMLPGSYGVQWEVRDVSGKSLLTDQRTIELKEAGAAQEVIIPLAMPQQGWFGLQLTVLDANRIPVFKHSASFALLGKDTRTAGYESPFGTWWFGGAHYSTRDIGVVGPLFFKAGLRRTTPFWTRDTEADLAPWKMSLNQIKWPFRIADLENWPAAEERAEKSISEMLQRFPHCQYIDLFHESYAPGAFPPELYGEKYEPKDDAQRKKEDQLYELALKASRFFRSKFPQLKIVAGNSGGSSGVIALLLRRGFPRELIDYLGSETTGQSIAPEKLSVHTTGGVALMGETARKFGYEIPLTGCFEFTSRAERDLCPQRLAEWYTRDTLIGLAHRFPTISPGGIEDVCNAYYDTLWGASGFCERRPLHYPKPAYVAMATLTKALDSTKLLRQIPTGSSSVWALEFERGAERVYVFWTPRGECALDLEFAADTNAVETGFYGVQKTRQTALSRMQVTASTAPCYLTSPVGVRRIALENRSFSNNKDASRAQILSRMDHLSDWELVRDDAALANSFRRPGEFELKEVEDPEKGRCLELIPSRRQTLPAVVGEYASLRLKQPVPILGTPHSVGVWLKGDSSWGRVFWELEDAKGERWISDGGEDGGDWGNHAAIDFDGWCFVTFPLTDASPASHLEPGSGAGQWKGRADKRRDYPLKLVGLHVETHRESLDLTRMQPVLKNIRLHGVGVISDTP